MKKKKQNRSGLIRDECLDSKIFKGWNFKWKGPDRKKGNSFIRRWEIIDKLIEKI